MKPSELELQELTRALDMNEALAAVHYACESFLTAQDHPAGIACIAIHDLQTNETLAFSRLDAPTHIKDEAREIHLLDRFYNQLRARGDARFLHWNMNRPEYGFEALATRYEYLTGNPPPVAIPERRVDLDELLTARFGWDYAPHPKLESVARLNDLDMRSFKSGKSEADFFAKNDWGTITRSTASKAKIIGELLRLFTAGKIRTSGSAGIVTFAGAHLDAVSVVLALGETMLPVQRSLRLRPQNRPPLEIRDEYDDQYLFRAMLVQFFEDVRDEVYVPSYAGKNSRIDFVLPQYKLAIELKHTREGLKDSELGEQLIIDRDRYQGRENPPATHLLCIVFDYEGRLRNPRALEEDLRRNVTTAKMAVTVRIYDR
jgi:hypothetical protein